MTNLLSRKNSSKKPRRSTNLERQAIGFTVGLYLFICVSLLTLHYAGPYMPQGSGQESSSTSPFNPR